jgi:intracellular sulfur oxidation DsrE/DsrF family protein
MKLKRFSVMVWMLFATIAAFAQHTDKHDNLVFLLRQPGHITQALKTVDQLRDSKNYNGSIHPGKIVIIICGEAVTEFAAREDSEVVQRARKAGVTLMGCGLSLQKFDLKKEALMPGVEYIDNGFIKSFELQKAGYLSVEL